MGQFLVSEYSELLHHQVADQDPTQSPNDVNNKNRKRITKKLQDMIQK